MGDDNEGTPEPPQGAGRSSTPPPAPHRKSAGKRPSRPPGDDDPHHDEVEGEPGRRSVFERTVPDVFKRVIERALESGVERLTEAPENLRDIARELKLPKEALQFLYGQVDDTKKGVYRVVAKEIRDVLEHTSFADEIADVLTKLSFEINTTIRFVPNKPGKDDEESAEAEPREGGEAEQRRIPRPQVVSKVVMKARESLDRRHPKKDA